MELALVIYLIDWLGDGNPFIGWGGVVWASTVWLIMWVVLAVCHDANTPGSTPATECFGYSLQTLRSFKSWFVGWLVFCSLGIIVNSILPNKDTAYKMLAAYGVTEVAKSEEVRQLGGKSLQVLEKAMDEYLDKSEE